MKVNYYKLWKLIIDKKIIKTYLSQKAEITTNEMAKRVKMETLVRICRVLDDTLDDIVEMK